MKTTSILFFSVLIPTINLQAQPESASDLLPPNFVKEFYKAYSGIPTAEKLAPFYHEEVVIDDLTYDWVGTNKQRLNHDSHDLRIIRIDRAAKSSYG